MTSKTLLHKISHLKWVFIVAVIALILYSFIAMPDNLLSIIGLLIFLAGIQLGLESLGDVEKLSEKSRIKYRDQSFVKLQKRITLFAITFLVVISTFFIVLKFIFPGQNTALFNDFFNVGIDCWALILGLFCQVKSTDEKVEYARKMEL